MAQHREGLHSLLYARPEDHLGNANYALVCHVGVFWRGRGSGMPCGLLLMTGGRLCPELVPNATPRADTAKAEFSCG